MIEELINPADPYVPIVPDDSLPIIDARPENDEGRSAAEWDLDAWNPATKFGNNVPDTLSNVFNPPELDIDSVLEGHHAVFAYDDEASQFLTAQYMVHSPNNKPWVAEYADHSNIRYSFVLETNPEAWNSAVPGQDPVGFVDSEYESVVRYINEYNRYLQIGADPEIAANYQAAVADLRRAVDGILQATEQPQQPNVEASPAAAEYQIFLPIVGTDDLSQLHEESRALLSEAGHIIGGTFDHSEFPAMENLISHLLTVNFYSPDARKDVFDWLDSIEFYRFDHTFDPEFNKTPTDTELNQRIKNRVDGMRTEINQQFESASQIFGSHNFSAREVPYGSEENINQVSSNFPGVFYISVGTTGGNSLINVGTGNLDLNQAHGVVAHEGVFGHMGLGHSHVEVRWVVDGDHRLLAGNYYGEPGATWVHRLGMIDPWIINSSSMANIADDSIQMLDISGIAYAYPDSPAAGNLPLEEPYPNAYGKSRYNITSNAQEVTLTLSEEMYGRSAAFFQSGNNLGLKSEERPDTYDPETGLHFASRSIIIPQIMNSNANKLTIVQEGTGIAVTVEGPVSDINTWRKAYEEADILALEQGKYTLSDFSIRNMHPAKPEYQDAFLDVYQKQKAKDSAIVVSRTVDGAPEMFASAEAAGQQALHLLEINDWNFESGQNVVALPQYVKVDDPELSKAAILS